jgi:hypothetical protein
MLRTILDQYELKSTIILLVLPHTEMKRDNGDSISYLQEKDAMHKRNKDLRDFGENRQQILVEFIDTARSTKSGRTIAFLTMPRLFPD